MRPPSLTFPPCTPLPVRVLAQRIGQDIFDLAFIMDADGELLQLLHKKDTLARRRHAAGLANPVSSHGRLLSYRKASPPRDRAIGGCRSGSVIRLSQWEDVWDEMGISIHPTIGPTLTLFCLVEGRAFHCLPSYTLICICNVKGLLLRSTPSLLFIIFLFAIRQLQVIPQIFYSTSQFTMLIPSSLCFCFKNIVYLSIMRAGMFYVPGRCHLVGINPRGSALGGIQSL